MVFTVVLTTTAYIVLLLPAQSPLLGESRIQIRENKNKQTLIVTVLAFASKYTSLQYESTKVNTVTDLNPTALPQIQLYLLQRQRWTNVNGLTINIVNGLTRSLGFCFFDYV